MSDVEWHLTYLGETLDVFDSPGDAERARSELTQKIMSNQLPDFLTADDFENWGGCYRSLAIKRYVSPW